MKDKIDIKYSKDVDIADEDQEILMEIVSNNSSKWIIATEAFLLGLEFSRRVKHGSNL